MPLRTSWFREAVQAVHHRVQKTMIAADRDGCRRLHRDIDGWTGRRRPRRYPERECA